MEKAVLVTVELGKDGRWLPSERSAELKDLALSAGAQVLEEVIVSRHDVDPAYFIGSGKARELALMSKDKHANTVIFNNDLSGTQQKNLEEVIRCKVIDRTQLILDIFARHAHSNEGKVQVELAQLMYLLPRLTGKGVELSRLGGGIGTRGPGEQKLEIDRRRIRTRITNLKRELEDLRKRRDMMRKKRERFSVLSGAIVGYTNAGKSTLLNALTNAGVIVQNKLFSTLDPTVRQFILPNKQKVLFADTVGFIDHLPHHLIEAFKATLEEVVEADILIHVIDASHVKAKEQAIAVYEVLKEIGAADKPAITVLNKIDKTDKDTIDRVSKAFDKPLMISAIKKEGFDRLIDRVRSFVDTFMTQVALTLPAGDLKTIGALHKNGRIIKKEYKEDTVYIEAEVPIKMRDLLLKRGI